MAVNLLMYAAMRTCIHTNELKSPTTTHTAEFVKEINILFDCLNSQSLYSSNPYKCAISEERLLIRLILEEAKHWCSSLEKCKGHSRLYTFEGLEWTINSILGIYKEQKKLVLIIYLLPDLIKIQLRIQNIENFLFFDKKVGTTIIQQEHLE